MSLRQRRKSIGESAKASSQSVKDTIVETTEAALQHWDQLPAWRRDNVYIQSGYRQIRASYGHSARSLFYVHNEFVNIWSHLLGALVFCVSSAYIYYAVRPRYASATSTDVVVFACFFTGAMTCLGMSATFHTLVDHSEAVAKWGNKLDYTGIVGLIVGSYVPALYYGFYCESKLMKLYLTLICSLGVGCTIVSWVDRFRKPEWRVYRATMFIGLGLSGVVPVLQGVASHGYQALEDRMSVSLIILHGAMYIFGAVLYAARWPERSFPGKFDIWGSSHQIFHIFVVLAAATHFYAMTKAFDYHHMVMESKC